jgi:uncharacterized membrane protein (UPF0127 family)
MSRCDPAHRFAATALFGLLLLSGCDNKPQSNLPTVQMQLGNKSFTLEVADTTATRTYGLMRRDSMPSDHGMIFVFPDEEERGFWMKNTRIPLDIVFVNVSGHVVSVKQMKPYDLNSTPSDGPAMYAIELNQGAAQSAQITAGMQVKLTPGLKAKD